MAIFLKFQSHSPYEELLPSLREEPSASLAMLVNAAHIQDIVWPMPQTANMAEERYWQTTQIGLSLSTDTTIEVLGFNQASAQKVRNVFDGLARRGAGSDSALICAVAGFAMGEAVTYTQNTNESPCTMDVSTREIEAHVLMNGHTVIDLSLYQDFSRPNGAGFVPFV